MRLRKFLIKALKVVAVLFLVILIVVGIVYYKAVSYDVQDLNVTAIQGKTPTSQEEFDQLAIDLVSQMSLKEKVQQMYGEPYISGLSKFLVNILGKERFPHVYVGKNERLGIPPWVLSDGPRGARVLDKDINGVTTFPVGMARGASWDPTLEYEVHRIIASEMRANKVNYAATPCINLLRHPGWGRAQETYGEDPWHLGEFGVAAVRGLEDNEVMACPKHFALNSIENSRWVVDVEVDERTLREVYLPHFKKTIQQGKPASLMSAYNSVNGAFAGSNHKLLTEILREDWGFKGFVSTDWLYGLYDGVAGVQAGLDVEMPFSKHYKQDVLEKGIENKEISESDINTIVQRSLATRLPYAFGKKRPSFSKDSIASLARTNFARKVAEESMVLLKNSKSVLPFSKTTGKKIAVIGRLANVINTGDKGSSDAIPSYVITPYEGITKYHEQLGNEVILNDGSDLESARQLAETSDEVIIVVGFTHEDEGEFIIFNRDDMEESAKVGSFVGSKTIGGDRSDLRLLESDENLIKSLVGSNDNMVVSYAGGSAIDMSSWIDTVPAVLFTWYSGMEGGNALARILYGDISPSGKLPFSIAQHQKDYPSFEPYTLSTRYDYYHGYTLFNKKGITPAFPFGYGLSYSSFEFKDLKTNKDVVEVLDDLEVEITVQNKGSVEAKEVIQLYVGFSNSSIDRPVKLLRGFDKISIAPGESKVVTFNLDIGDISWYNTATSNWEVEEITYELYAGNSSSQKDLLKTIFKVGKLE